MLSQALTDFFWRECPYLHITYTPEILENLITKHICYLTVICMADEKGLVSACRFNIHNDTAEILDIAARPDKRNNGILKGLLKKGLAIWPKVKRLQFHDMAKGKYFNISIENILKEKANGVNKH